MHPYNSFGGENGNGIKTEVKNRKLPPKTGD